MVELGLSRCLGRLLHPIMAPLFRVNGSCAAALALGFVGGYPVGARTAIQLYQQGQCSKTEAQRLLAFCNNSGPAFILGAVGAGVDVYKRQVLGDHLHVGLQEGVALALQGGHHVVEGIGVGVDPVSYTHLGYTFQDKSLLENALTHSSCANESKGRLQSNERLEFLGDSILGMVVADHLYRNHPDLPEGDLTRTRAALVCEESLVVVAEELGLSLIHI